MAESTLSVDYFRIVRSLARQLGTGRVYHAGTVGVSSGVVTLTGGTFPSWAANAAAIFTDTPYAVATRDSDTQLTLSDTSVTVTAGANFVLIQSDSATPENAAQDFIDWVDTGYNEFLYPETGHSEQFSWSFLRRVESVALSSGDADIDLPDSFGQHMLAATLTGQDDDEPARLDQLSREEMREKREYESGSNAVPAFAAWQPKAFDATTGERFELIVHPTPDDSYTVKVEYRDQPDRLTPAAPYPRGGMLHGDTILKACQAAAERDQDDEAGVLNQRFKERLAASLQMDMAITGEVRNAGI